MQQTNPHRGKTERRLWYEDGCWRYFCPAKGCAREISSLMREAAYDPADLAAALGLGNRSFRRIVKNAFGIPPGQWLRQERAVAAGYRLRSGCSIKRLAAEYGFRHQGDFCDEFKRWYEMSPSRFLMKVTGSPSMEVSESLAKKPK